MMAAAKCDEHSGVCEAVSTLKKQQETVFEKIDTLTRAVYVLMGGVFVLWPAIQVMLWIMQKKLEGKP
ncbi:MAG: hypothetical protein ABFD97_20335 [Syntrophobacter sp.]